MLIKTKKLNQVGDTILEVLISVAVLSLILTTSFVLANRSTQYNRQAAERGEASKLAQAQLEDLKSFLDNDTTTLPASPNYFCLQEDSTNTVSGFKVITLSASGNIDDPTLSNGFFTQGNMSNCQNGFYYKFIQKAGNTFTVYMRWPAVTGNGVDKINLVHKIYPDTASNLLSVANNGTSPILPPPFPGIVLSAPSFTPAGNVTIGWSVINFISPCITTGPWTGPKTTSNGSEVVSLALPGTYNFSLTCTYLGNSETKTVIIKVPPPITVAGSSYNHPCTPVESNGCEDSGTSVFSCQGYIATYPIAPISGTGYTKLYLNYGDDNTVCSLSPTPPAPWTYRISIYINGIFNVSYNLPTVPQPSTAAVLIPLNGVVPSASTIQIKWDNNEWVPGPFGQFSYDPDLQIYEIGLR